MTSPDSEDSRRPERRRRSGVLVSLASALAVLCVGTAATVSVRPVRRAGDPVPVQLTAYCLQGTTRRDNRVREGIVAADPRLFPLGRYVELYVGRRYHGRFLVDDTGSRIREGILDIWTPSCRDALCRLRRVR